MRIFFQLICFFPLLSLAQQATVKSPDGQLEVRVFLEGGKALYEVKLANELLLEPSPLGLQTNLVDYATGLKWVDSKEQPVAFTYEQDKIKRKQVRYEATELTCVLQNKEDKPIHIAFRVSNSDIGLRYELPAASDPLALVVERELTGFNFPQETKGFLTPQSKSMVGFKRTKPSYEEGYVIEQEISARSANGLGYTFPALFRKGNYWTLLSETGVHSGYCGSHLSDPTADGVYSIAFPDITENNGFGSSGAAIGLPATTPWRTITVGSSLKPVVETTIAYDLVERLYAPSTDYQFGKGTWSWIMWQDWSMNYNDQVKYIDLAAELGYPYILIDALWDQNIGYERMAELLRYAASKNVSAFLWYNSNGAANDAPMSPRNKMNTSIARKKEMQWMKENGVKGIKVDFFGGDKQEVIRLYEDIFSDANDYGLMVVCHGATLPRGWERMYPNFVGSEAVLASENLMFSQGFNDAEAFHATLHPFIRNTTAVMEYGGTVLNKRYNRTNDGGNTRRTTDVFQLAASVLFQNPVQFFALAPNNLTDAPAFAIDFMKKVPTTWEETMFLEGYPGKYAVLSRKGTNGVWYAAGVNATKEPMQLKLSVPMFSGKEINLYADRPDGTSFTQTIRVDKKGDVTVTIQPNGGIVLTEK